MADEWNLDRLFEGRADRLAQQQRARRKQDQDAPQRRMRESQQAAYQTAARQAQEDECAQIAREFARLALRNGLPTNWWNLWTLRRGWKIHEESIDTNPRVNRTEYDFPHYLNVQYVITTSGRLVKSFYEAPSLSPDQIRRYISEFLAGR